MQNDIIEHYASLVARHLEPPILGIWLDQPQTIQACYFSFDETGEFLELASARAVDSIARVLLNA